MDGEVGFTGGVGVADHWMGHAQDAEHWRDTQFRLRGPIVRLLEAVFCENFIETDGEVTPELDDPRGCSKTSSRICGPPHAATSSAGAGAP